MQNIPKFLMIHLMTQIQEKVSKVCKAIGQFLNTLIDMCTYIASDAVLSPYHACDRYIIIIIFIIYVHSLHYNTGAIQLRKSVFCLYDNR